MVEWDTYKFDSNLSNDEKWEIKFKVSKEKSKDTKGTEKTKEVEKTEITIQSLVLNWKTIKLEDFAKDKDGEKKFNKIFPWWKGYLVVEWNLLELTFDKKEWIKIREPRLTNSEWERQQ